MARTSTVVDNATSSACVRGRKYVGKTIAMSLGSLRLFSLKKSPIKLSTSAGLRW